MRWTVNNYVTVAKVPLPFLSEIEKEQLRELREEYVRVFNLYIRKIYQIRNALSSYVVATVDIGPTKLSDRWLNVVCTQVYSYIIRNKDNIDTTKDIIPKIITSNCNVVRMHAANNSDVDLFVRISTLNKYYPIWVMLDMPEDAKQAIAAYKTYTKRTISRTVHLEYDDTTDTWSLVFLHRTKKPVPVDYISRHEVPDDISMFLPNKLPKVSKNICKQTIHPRPSKQSMVCFRRIAKPAQQYKHEDRDLLSPNIKISISHDNNSCSFKIDVVGSEQAIAMGKGIMLEVIKKFMEAMMVLRGNVSCEMPALTRDIDNKEQAQETINATITK